MRLLIGVPNVWWGGLQSWATYLADWLPEDWDVGFAFWRGKPEAIEDLTQHGTPLRIWGAQLCGWQVNQNALNESAAAVVEAWEPDVVQANCPTLARAAKQHGVPCVTTGHSLRGCHANGAALADRAVRVSPAVPGNEPIIVNGITPVAFDGDHVENEVAVATRLDRDRFPHLVFDAMRLVADRRPEVRFRVIGCNHDGWFDEEKELAARSLEDNVEMLGLVPHDEAVCEIARADVVCQPWPESFGQAVCEGMSAGCIPVASSKAFGPDLVGDAGFCAPVEPDAVADAIVQALDCEDKAARRQAAIERVEMCFHGRRFANDYREVYEELAS